MLTIVTWIWKGERDYRIEHAETLAASIRRHATFEHRFVVISDQPCRSSRVETMTTPQGAQRLASLKTPEGGRFPSSYRRLWLFSEEARALGDKILLTDVDAVAVADWAPLLDYADDFVGWRPRMVWGEKVRLAGGMWLLRTGTRQRVYDDFIEAPNGAIRDARAAGYRGSDQAWISYCLGPSAIVWPEGSGVYSVRDLLPRDARSGKPTGKSARWEKPPADARVVHFNGPVKQWDPAILGTYPWVAEHWR